MGRVLGRGVVAESQGSPGRWLWLWGSSEMGVCSPGLGVVCRAGLPTAGRTTGGFDLCPQSPGFTGVEVRGGRAWCT